MSLAAGGTVQVYGESTRWSPTHISVPWVDHVGHTNWAWIPKENVRRATDSEWDIGQYRRCAEVNRVIRRGTDCRGFSPLMGLSDSSCRIVSRRFGSPDRDGLTLVGIDPLVSLR